MSTIKDVARRAGVAPSTVSHYFTGNARVSEATRAKIEEAVRTLGYRPNLAARSLRLSQTHTIGLVVPNIANPFFAEIVQSIGFACQQLGYSLLLADSGNDERRELELLQSLYKQHIDGMLIIHTGKRDERSLMATNPPIPIVFVDREVDGLSSVTSDNYAGGRLAARHLAGLGHRRIGILAGDPHVQNVQQRIAGFRDELKEFGLSVGPKYVINGSQTFETGRDVQFLMVLSKPPTAIFATNDIIALGAWNKLCDMKLRVPEDISLVGYDNIDMAEWTVPPLTTVAQDKRELGRQSVVRLIREIQVKDSTPTVIHIPPRLIVRGSTATRRSGA